ncbi:unnamed protein product, partial [Musa textilis]
VISCLNGPRSFNSNTHMIQIYVEDKGERKGCKQCHLQRRKPLQSLLHSMLLLLLHLWSSMRGRGKHVAKND